jgi:glycosyltransferase involved in cell wall biosynthesis
MRVARGCISFIPNGVEEPKVNYPANWRAKLALQPGQHLVVKIANVTSFKDHATLLRAWKIVQDSWRGSQRPFLALAGWYGDRYEECQRIVREANLDSTVRFLDSISDVPALIHASDVAAFSSVREGMPNGVLECMAAGKAVVASDVPGVRDALGPNDVGAVVPPGDSAQFARKLLDLLCNETKRDALGKANRARVRAEFSVERMAERYLQIIQASLQNIRGGSSTQKVLLSSSGVRN